MLKKFDDSIASVVFNFATWVYDATFGKNVVEGNSRFQLFVSFNFSDTTQNISFNDDDERRVVLIENVE